MKFGPSIAANIRHSRPRPSDHSHLDEMVISIRGDKYWLWRAVDNEGEVLDLLVQRRRDTPAAKKLMVKLLKKHGFAPSRVRKAIEEPDHVPRLGLRGRAGTHVTLVITWFERAAHRIGSEVPVEAPQEWKVAVDVHADAL